VIRARHVVPWALTCALAVPTRAARAEDTPAPQAGAASSPSDPRPPRGAGDQRRTVRSYPQNLGYNLLGVVTRGNWTPLAAGTGLGASALLLDDEVQGYFVEHPYRTLADAGQTLGSGLVVVGLTVGFFSAGRVARRDRFRAATYDLSQAMLVNGAWTFALKTTVRRQRPNGGDRLSFPSGHASNAFATATVLSRHYGLKTAVSAYTVAGLIAASRMAKNVHHLSDVVFGAAFGYGVGRAVVRRNSRPPTVPGEPTPPTPKDPAALAVWPDAGPAGDGVGLALSLRF
jgi:membrane-associated phospholipid phosphatase